MAKESGNKGVKRDIAKLFKVSAVVYASIGSQLSRAQDGRLFPVTCAHRHHRRGCTACLRMAFAGRAKVSPARVGHGIFDARSDHGWHFTRLTTPGSGFPMARCYGQSSPRSAGIRFVKRKLRCDGPVTASKAWIEMAHRYLALAVEC